MLNDGIVDVAPFVTERIPFPDVAHALQRAVSPDTYRWWWSFRSGDMSGKCFLGLDIGTLGVKGVIVTADGRVLARGRCEHGVSHPAPGWAEQDAKVQWWATGGGSSGSCWPRPTSDPANIAAVGVSAWSPACA